ncbi:MAG: acetamidase/formamidase family protein [Kordiimonas sp.]
MKLLNKFSLALSAASIMIPMQIASASSPVIVGGEGETCLEDQGCINRFHSDIPMQITAKPGDEILFRTRDAADVFGTIDHQPATRPANPPIDFGRIHPVTGPVNIEGAKAGDVVAITIKKITPGKYAWTSAGSFGFASDLSPGEILVMWDLKDGYATSPDLPGIKVPSAGFPGIVTTLPSKEGLSRSLAREAALHKAGGVVSLPDSRLASPSNLCGPEGTSKDECLRTIPPREHGGNMDIRYLKEGVTIYLPCNIDGCGIAIGDLHFAQGDGEIGGSAIEMSADVLVTTQILNNGPDLTHGPHYEGPSGLLDIPSRQFYAVTGFPFKKAGTIPPEMAYAANDAVKPLENLSNDINLAARNAADGIIDYIVKTYGYTRSQAYIIASIAVDIRIAQLVDGPNVGATALLPLDIFVSKNN